MRHVTLNLQTLPREDPEYQHITTTLYELIEAINEELQPGEKGLLERIVSDLAEGQRIQFLVKSPEQRIDGV